MDGVPKRLLKVDEDEEEEKVVMEKSAEQKTKEKGNISRK